MIKLMPHRRPKVTVKTLEFQAKDWQQHPKNSFWYLGMGILLVGLLVAAITFGQYLLALVVVAAAVAIFRLHDLSPPSRKVKLTKKGLTWGDRFFGYHQLRAFWLAQQGGRATLYLERLNLAPAISVVIPAQSVEPTAAFLSEFLPYHTHRSEPLSDRLSHLLKL